MQSALDLCAYCERTSQELVDCELAESRDQALEWAKVGSHRILLCPELLYAGFTETEATATLTMVATDDGFLTVRCPHCGVVVKSR